MRLLKAFLKAIGVALSVIAFIIFLNYFPVYAMTLVIILFITFATWVFYI